MVGYHQTNQKTDTGKTLTRWPVLVDHNRVDHSSSRTRSSLYRHQQVGQWESQFLRGHRKRPWEIQSYDVPYVKLYLGNPKQPLRPVDENELKKVFLACFLQFQANSVLNFAHWAIITISQQTTIFCAYLATTLLFLFWDPVSGSHGSSSPPHNTTSCKYNM